jgi:hypothetical protein
VVVVALVGSVLVVVLAVYEARLLLQAEVVL